MTVGGVQIAFDVVQIGVNLLLLALILIRRRRLS